MASRDNASINRSSQNNIKSFGLTIPPRRAGTHHDLKPGNILLDRDFRPKYQISAPRNSSPTLKMWSAKGRRRPS